MPSYINPFNEIKALHTLSTHMDQAKGSDKIAVFGIAFIAGLAAAAAGICSFGVGATPAFRWVVHRWYDLEGENGSADKPEQSKKETTPPSSQQKRLFSNEFSNVEVTVRQQDIFNSGAVAIVNAANPHLQLSGNSGINGAIIKQGGKDYCAAHTALHKKHPKGFPRGDAALLPSGDLKQNGIQHVIVVAGPDMKKGSSTRPITKEDRDQLYNCYYNSLLLANEQGIASIAFPAISTGAYKFDCKEAAEISKLAIKDFLSNCPNTSVKTISIHGFGASYNAY